MNPLINEQQLRNRLEDRIKSLTERLKTLEKDPSVTEDFRSNLRNERKSAEIRLEKLNARTNWSNL